jgi:hypothetical protein
MRMKKPARGSDAIDAVGPEPGGAEEAKPPPPEFALEELDDEADAPGGGSDRALKSPNAGRPLDAAPAVAPAAEAPPAPDVVSLKPDACAPDPIPG